MKSEIPFLTLPRTTHQRGSESAVTGYNSPDSALILRPRISRKPLRVFSPELYLFCGAWEVALSQYDTGEQDTLCETRRGRYVLTLSYSALRMRSFAH